MSCNVMSSHEPIMNYVLAVSLINVSNQTGHRCCCCCCCLCCFIVIVIAGRRPSFYRRNSACMIQNIPMAMASTEEPRERFLGRFGLLTTFPNRIDPSPNSPAAATETAEVAQAAVVAVTTTVVIISESGGIRGRKQSVICGDTNDCHSERVCHDMI